jgi:hypothetical protein
VRRDVAAAVAVGIVVFVVVSIVTIPFATSTDTGVALGLLAAFPTAVVVALLVGDRRPTPRRDA